MTGCAQMSFEQSLSDRFCAFKSYGRRHHVGIHRVPDGHDEEPSPDALPDELLSEQERKVRVQRALSALPADQYEVVVLSYIEGLSHSEIAERLGLPLGTVKSRMRLAYGKVRESVEDLK